MLHWFWPFFWILHQFLIQKQAYLQRLLEASAQEHSFEISTKVYVSSFLQFLVEFCSRIFTELRNQTAKCALDLLQDKTFLMQDFHTLNESHKHEPSALTTIRTLTVAIFFWAVIYLLSTTASGQQKQMWTGGMIFLRCGCNFLISTFLVLAYLNWTLRLYLKFKGHRTYSKLWRIPWEHQGNWKRNRLSMEITWQRYSLENFLQLPLESIVPQTTMTKESIAPSNRFIKKLKRANKRAADTKKNCNQMN